MRHLRGTSNLSDFTYAELSSPIPKPRLDLEAIGGGAGGQLNLQNILVNRPKSGQEFGKRPG